MSIFSKPLPWQVSQRPPTVLNENVLALRPRWRAAGVSANSLRTWSHALT